LAKDACLNAQGIGGKTEKGVPVGQTWRTGGIIPTPMRAKKRGTRQKKAPAKGNRWGRTKETSKYGNKWENRKKKYKGVATKGTE